MKKSFGFYLSVLSAILVLVCVYLYSPVGIKNDMVRPLLIASAVLTAIVLAVSAVKGKLPGGNLLPLVNAGLCIAAVGKALTPMITQVVQAFLGMSPMSSIQGFLTFAVLVLFTWLVNIVAAFLGIAKKTT